MPSYVAFLRGINSGNNPSQKMENLRKVFEKLGFKNVKTVIASGNVLFETKASARGPLIKKIELALKKGTGVESSTILWTKEEVEALVKNNPFKKLKPTVKNRPFVSFLKNQDKHELKLPKKGKGYALIGILGGAVCFTIDASSTKTPDVMKIMEKEFGRDITTRSWNTVVKIANL